MGFTLSQSQPLFSPKRKSVYPIFDIFLDKLKCQIPPVAYHLFEFFGGGNPQFLSCENTNIIIISTHHL